MTPLQTALLLHFAPAWSRRVALSPGLAAQTISRPILSGQTDSGAYGRGETLLLPHLPANDPRYAEMQLSAHDLDESPAHSLDLIYLSAGQAPQSTRQAVELFARLDGGGRVIMETADGRAARRALYAAARGNGLDVIYFGRPRTPGVVAELPELLGRRGDASREAAVAVLARPPLPSTHLSRESGERPQLSLTLSNAAGDLSVPANTQRMLAWRDWLLASGLHKTTELLLIADGPTAALELKEFASAELRDLRRSNALRVIAHYRPLGRERCEHTAVSQAEGRLLYSEELPAFQAVTGKRYAFQMPCRELMGLIQALWKSEDQATGRKRKGHSQAIQARPRGLLVQKRGRERVAKTMGRDFPAAQLSNAAALAQTRANPGKAARATKSISENVCLEPINQSEQNDRSETGATPLLPPSAH